MMFYINGLRQVMCVCMTFSEFINMYQRFVYTICLCICVDIIYIDINIQHNDKIDIGNIPQVMYTL